MITAKELRNIYKDRNLSASFSRMAINRMDSDFDYCVVAKNDEDSYENWKEFVEELKRNGYCVHERVVGGKNRVIVEW